MNNNPSGHAEIIETVNGRTFHLAVDPEPQNENVLCGYSPNRKSPYIYKLLPVVNIRQRRLDCRLGEILLEKGFIGSEILQQALDEHRRQKAVKLGKILARKTKITSAAIEEVLARTKDRTGLKVGEILVASGLVDEKQVADSLHHQKSLHNMKIGRFLVEKGVVQEEEVCMALAEKFRLPFVDLGRRKVRRKTLMLLSRDFILSNEILPIDLEDDVLTVAALLPDVSYLREEIKKEAGVGDVRFVLALPTHLRIVIDQLVGTAGDA